MRVAATVLLAAFAASIAGPAKADPHPWCAIFSGDLGGVRSCYFFTLEQCRATVSGVGGYCSQNPWYTGAPSPGPARRVTPRN